MDPGKPQEGRVRTLDFLSLQQESSIVNLPFNVCDLDFEVSCNNELAPYVSSVIGPFNSPRPGRYMLDLRVLPERISKTPVAEPLQIISFGSRKMKIALSHANRESIAAAVGCLLYLALCKENGVLLHASTLVTNDRAYVFTGKAGAGKTTIANNALDMQCIHDDKVAVRFRNGEWWAYGVPMMNSAGVIGKNMDASLASLFFIERGNSLRKKSLSRKTAMFELTAHTVSPILGGDCLKLTVECLLSLVAGVDCWRLSFERDSNVKLII